MSRRAWEPLLAGELHARALAGARAIALALGELTGPEQWAPGYGGGVAASLASGAAGLAVTLRTLADTGVAPEVAARVDPLLDFAFETVAAEVMEPDLFGGLAGIGWAVSRLEPAPSAVPRAPAAGAPSAPPEGGDDPACADDDPLSEVDAELVAVLEREPWEGPFDLVGGLAGLGLYALERLPRAAGRVILEQVVGLLERSAEASGGVVTWRTRPEWLHPSERERTPKGRYDLGVAHGVPGVIGLLAQACGAGVAVERARPLLDGAVAWLLARRQPAGAACDFPYFVTSEGPGPPSRSAWCYGDPGVSALLLHAARCVAEPAWERTALAIARRAARRAAEGSRVVDAGLCHGAAGLAHLWNRIYQRTGDEEIGRAAITWIERTLAMRQPGHGHAGYTTAVRELAGGHRFEDDPSLLAGAAGTALALAAATSAVEPTWDRMLLLASAAEP